MRMNIFGELRLMKDLNIKPNFSALQREYNIDRHTIFPEEIPQNGEPPK